jgi:two-component system cell cycle sensor histidine kinase/response regulator CckA
MSQVTGRTVLVVEDQDPVRAMIVRILAGDGYLVLEARDGVEALEVLEANPDVSLILTDLEMPRMNGFELADRLASLRNTQILFLSGYADHLRKPPTPFLQKPFTAEVLSTQVQRLLAPSQAQA